MWDFEIVNTSSITSTSSLQLHMIFTVFVHLLSIYIWFKHINEVESQEVFLLRNGLAVLALSSSVVNLHLDLGPTAPKYKTSTQVLLPLGLVTVIIWPYFGLHLISYTLQVVSSLTGVYFAHLKGLTYNICIMELHLFQIFLAIILLARTRPVPSVS